MTVAVIQEGKSARFLITGVPSEEEIFRKKYPANLLIVFDSGDTSKSIGL